MPLPSFVPDRWLRLVVLFVVAGIGGAIYLANRSTNQTETTRPSPDARRNTILSQSRWIVEVLKERPQDPWIRGTTLQNTLLECTSTVSDLIIHIEGLDLNGVSSMDGSPRDLILANAERRITPLFQAVTRFVAIIKDDLPAVRDAFTTLGATAEALRVLREASISAGELETRHAASAQSYEDGRRFWTEALRQLLLLQDYDDTMRRAGLAGINKSKTDISPHLEPLRKAREEVIRLNQHESGIRRRLTWAAELIERLPKNDPIRGTPAADYPALEKRWHVLLEKIDLHRAKSLKRTRAEERDLADLEMALLKFLEEMSAPLLKRAAELGEPLPN